MAAPSDDGLVICGDNRIGNGTRGSVRTDDYVKLIQVKKSVIAATTGNPDYYFGPTDKAPHFALDSYMKDYFSHRDFSPEEVGRFADAAA